MARIEWDRVGTVAEFLLPRLVGGGYTHQNLELSQGGSLMKRIIMLLLLGMFLGPLGTWDATGAWAQSRHEPRIEGVSYSEMAQWHSWYGGGPFYGQTGVTGYGVDCDPPLPVLYEPVSFDVKKVRRAKRSRK